MGLSRGSVVWATAFHPPRRTESWPHHDVAFSQDSPACLGWPSTVLGAVPDPRHRRAGVALAVAHKHEYKGIQPWIQLPIPPTVCRLCFIPTEADLGPSWTTRALAVARRRPTSA